MLHILNNTYYVTYTSWCNMIHVHVHAYIHVRLMIHNVVMNTQRVVYPREAIDSCSRTCPRDEDRRKLMRSSSVINWLPKCWGAPRGSRHAPLDALRGRNFIYAELRKNIPVFVAAWDLWWWQRGEKGIEPLAVGRLPPGFVLQR